MWWWRSRERSDYANLDSVGAAWGAVTRSCGFAIVVLVVGWVLGFLTAVATFVVLVWAPASRLSCAVNAYMDLYASCSAGAAQGKAFALVASGLALP